MSAGAGNAIGQLTELTMPFIVRYALIVLVLGQLTQLKADDNARAPRQRRLLYNLDGDSCMFLKKGSIGPTEVRADDLKTIVAEIAGPGSQVDTLLLCINAQCTYYPSKVGTMRDTLIEPQHFKDLPASEQQRYHNVAAMFSRGIDPYAVLLAEAKQRGLEALLSYRMNDAHGANFLYCKLWLDHPEYRLGAGLDFAQEPVREYTFQIVQEAVQRYDCDGIELDFNRFPNYFQKSAQAVGIVKINDIVYRVRQMLDAEGQKRGRHLVLGVRVPTSYQECLTIGLDPVLWAEKNWIDFLTVSEFLFTRYDLPVKPWKEQIKQVPIYASIEGSEKNAAGPSMTAAKYRQAARHLSNEGVDGIYLFNFFTAREWGPQASEPPFEVLNDLGAVNLLHGSN